MADIVAPIVHLNGTSKNHLLSALSDAYDALDAAAESLRQCSPNGRDYYLDPGLLNKAVDQHHDRMKAVRDVQEGIEKEMELIHKQGR
jgi:hypothetical protein